MDNALQYMQKKKNVAIYSILVLTIILVIISAIVIMYPVPYSLKNSSKNNANIVPVFLGGSHYNKQILLHFLTYQDPVYGIKIQYPSDWEKIKPGKDFIVGFVSPSSRDSGVLENVMISADRLSSPTTSLNSFGNTRISTLES